MGFDSSQHRWYIMTIYRGQYTASYWASDLVAGRLNPSVTQVVLAGQTVSTIGVNYV